MPPRGEPSGGDEEEKEEEEEEVHQEEEGEEEGESVEEEQEEEEEEEEQPNLPGPPAVPGAGAYTEAQALELLRERNTLLLDRLTLWSDQRYAALTARKAAFLEELIIQEGEAERICYCEEVFDRMASDVLALQPEGSAMEDTFEWGYEGPMGRGPKTGIYTASQMRQQLDELEASWFRLAKKIRADLQAQLRTFVRKLQAKYNTLAQQLDKVTADWTDNLNSLQHHLLQHSPPGARPAISDYGAILVAGIEAHARVKQLNLAALGFEWTPELQRTIERLAAESEVGPGGIGPGRVADLRVWLDGLDDSRPSPRRPRPAPPRRHRRTRRH